MFGSSRDTLGRRPRVKSRPSIEGLEARRLLSGDPPTAVDDMFMTDRNVAVSVDLLANDTDPETDALTARIAQAPANGQLSPNGDGTFTYTPNLDFTGDDTFTYIANDGTSDGDPATVTITVNAVNRAPVAVDDSPSIPAGQAAAINVLANDTDADDDPLTVTIVDQPTHGMAEVNTDGSVTYTPDAGYRGADSFTYTVNDGQADSNVAAVLLDVQNNVPVAADDTATTDEDTPVTFPVLTNDSDADADPLTVTIATMPGHGMATVNVDGVLTYTPAANFNGTDSFTYQVTDGQGGTDTATVTVTVNPVNDAPVAAGDAATVNAGGSATIPVLTNDVDPDGDPLIVTIADQPGHGSAVVNADGTVAYTPTAGYRGPDSFTYTVNDGTDTSNVATVTITVGNNAPVAVVDTATTNEDTPVTIAVLANDTDADSDPLTVVIADNPSHGTATVNVDGVITYTPAANYNGTDTFTYRVGDGQGGMSTATVTVTVNSVNDTPVATKDSYATSKNGTLTITAPGVLGNDTDAEGSTLSATVVADVAHGTLTLSTNGSFVYTPTAGYVGTDTFTYRASDGTLMSDPATVTITISNRTPTATADVYSTARNTALTIAAPGVLANDTDPDGDPITATIITSAGHGTVAFRADGSFTYTPNPGFAGTDTFSYSVSDGVATSPVATVTIAVGSANRTPIATADAYTLTANGPLVVAAPGILANDSDPDGDALTAKVGTNPTHGTLILNANGSFTYTPVAGYTGTDSFTYTINDGTIDSAPATVTLTIRVASPAATLTAAPQSGTDVGTSTSDGFTSVNRPSFIGAAPAGSTIRLFAQAATGTLTQVGTSIAGSDGRYYVTTGSPLSDGGYDFLVTADGVAGVGGQTVKAATLVIDTAAPRVASVTIDPAAGRVLVRFDKTLSALDLNSVGFPGNYSVQRLLGRGRARALAITSIALIDASTVAIVLRGGLRLASGNYRVAVSGGVLDRAGNFLDGEFFNQFPSGNGAAGGTFIGRFSTNGPMTSGVNIASLLVLGASTPTGPIVSARSLSRKSTLS